jgi:hypothetical protein
MKNQERQSLKRNIILINREKKDQLINLKQEQFMKENGKEVLEMVRELRDGQTGLCILGSGKRIELMARANSFMLMGTSMKVSGLMIKLMDLVSTDM